jgi:hypothetical protein
MIDFKNCTEEELWKYVGAHLESKGLEVVLVGGAVVSIYSKGAYKSGDLDFIVTSMFKEKLPEYMKEIGFQRDVKGSLGRLYRHPELSHLVVEFPPGPVSIGDDYHITPAEEDYDGQKIKILSPTDCIIDRLASYIYAETGPRKERKTLEQAVLVAKAQPHNLERIKKWCESEGQSEVYETFLTELKKKI